MKKTGFAFFSLWLLTFAPNHLNAYPSSLFWTTCTTYVVPTGVANFQVANYFTVFNKDHHGQAFPTDVGLTLGLLTWCDWKAEVGIDYLGSFDYPWYFNGKVGIEESKLFAQAPSFSVGIYDVGTQAGITNLNIVNAVVGKTLPNWLSGGELFLGAFVGSHTLGRDQGGYMVGYLNVFCPAKDCNGVDYWKWWLVADYASGKNFLGGGGVGITYFFNSRACVLTGPTWFNDAHLNKRWKWTVQIDIFFPVFQTRKKC